jgi:hypothetical protein
MNPTPYAAFCTYHGFKDLGIAYHMGKIMECGALCSTPKSREALAIVRHDRFDIVPLDPNSRCTVVCVAAHSLFEKLDPTYFMVQMAHFFYLMPAMSSCQTIALCAYEAHVSNRWSKGITR